MKEALSYHLDDLKNTKLEKAIIVLQVMAKGFLARKRYLRERQAVLAIQSAIRSYLARLVFKPYETAWCSCYICHYACIKYSFKNLKSCFWVIVY